MSRQKLLFSLAIMFTIFHPSILAQSPTFVTQNPTSGIVGRTFIVLLPLANMGTGTAADIETQIAFDVIVTSVKLGNASMSLPTLPSSRGPYAPTEPDVLVLQFDEANLTVGQRYLLTVGGTYQVNGQTLGFAVNRFLTVTTSSELDQIELEHWVAMDAVDTKLKSLAGIDPATDNQEMLAFLQSRPEFVDSGINADFLSVWATFANGEPFIIANDRHFPTTLGPANLRPAIDSPSLSSETLSPRRPAYAAATADAQKTGLPVSSTVLMSNGVSGFGLTAFDSSIYSEISDLTRLLQDQKYRVASGTASLGSLYNNVVGQGVFYFATHTGIHGDTVALWTSDAVTPALDKIFRDNFELGATLLPMKIDEGRYDTTLKKWFPVLHYAITSAFVRKNFSFSDNSFVYIDSCAANNDSPGAEDMRQAFFDAHASAYAGWTRKVDPEKAANTARLIFDRLLGANKFALETLPQRPFDWGSAVQDAGYHTEECPGLFPENGTTCGFDAATDAFLIIAANTKSESQFSLLAPSISYMTMNEGNVSGTSAGQLTINGIFGSEQGSVMVGGKIDTSDRIPVVKDGLDAQIKSWSPSGDQIVVELPLSGLGSAGNVQVVVRNHFSNVAQLTEWRTQSDQVTFTLSGSGSLQQQQNYGLHLRADIRQWRKVIHFPPSEPEGRPIASAQDSTATISSSGTAPDAFGQTFKWSGSRSLINIFGSPGVLDNFFFLNGQVNDSKHMIYALDALSTDGGTCTICGPSGCSVSPLFSTGPFGWFTIWFLQPTYSNAEFELHGDSVSIKGDVSGSGTDFVCSPTNDNMLHGKFTWGSISSVPGTAPDPNSAR